MAKAKTFRTEKRWAYGIVSKARVQKLVRVGALALMVVASACAPRGESKSLDEVLEASKQRYSQVKTVEVSPEVKGLLKTTLENLEVVESSGGRLSSARAGRVVLALSDLISHAGYTVRPALSELNEQYLAIAESGNAENNAVLLLVSRTYSLLASELETTRFQM